MDNAFASLAHIRVLLLPVGNVQRPTFERWAEEFREFEEIRLSDVPADSRDDRARFMPNPLATGSLVLSFTEHPPPPSSSKLDLFRPSDFPLGIVGIASCSQSDVLSSIYSQFNASRGELFPSNSIYPFAQNCFVFEEGDGNTNLNVGNHMPGLVVIPSMMGNKKLYIGTLLAELCSNILGEFSMMVKTLETPSGSEALNAGLFARMPNYKASRASLDVEETGRPSSVASPLHSLQDRGSPSRQTDPRLNVKRASTLGPSVMGPSNRALQQVSQVDKRRQSVLSTATGSHARLYKVLGDLFLLAGRTMDASIWYNEATAVLKGSQDLPWQASALEGMAVAGFLEFWSSTHSPPANSWSDLGDKLLRARSLYAAAADVADSEGRMPELSFLYVRACLRHASLMYYIWLGNGFNTLAFDALLHGRLDARNLDEQLRLSSANSTADISRSAISEVLTQVHGPWLLHLDSRERLESLRSLSRMYSGLRYRRKEAYVLRELVACLLDLLVQGREETKGTSELSLGLPDESRARRNLGNGSVGVREREDAVGNASILRVVKYICGVHGIDLDSVGFSVTKSINGTRDSRDSSPEIQHAKQAILRQSLLRSTWPDLQVGLIRESLAVAEALPDYPAVALFALSALRDLYTLLDPEDQFHLHTAASRAIATNRRRGDERNLEYWPVDLTVNIRFVPLPFVRLPHERPWADIQSQSESAEQAVGADPFLFNPRRVLSSKRKVFAVANEDLDFVVMLDNPYAIALEVLEVELSTTGVPFVGRPRSVVIQGNSSETVTLSGQATEPGTLVVRGCKVLLPGVERHEIVLPILSEEEEEDRFLKSVAQFNEGERAKSPSLNDRFDKKCKHISTVISEASDKAMKPSRFLELEVVPEQPCLRIRRTSLTNGAVMLYDGETSTIRLTVENISNLPIDFLELTFDDSTRPQLEQIMSDDSTAFDIYEAEHNLVNKPVFSWEPDKSRKEIASGKESVISVKCFGRAGCTDGTMFISYSYARRERDSSSPPPSTFFTRQLLFPVLVTVYQMLECSGMNILPISALATVKDGHNEWNNLLAGVDDSGWSVLTLDVQNIYGLAFEVILSYNSKVSTSRVIPPGSTYRLLLPIERFSLPTTVTTAPIPSLTNRQYVVSGLANEEDKAQRELFWHREELLKKVHASWKEAAGSRTGELSLRTQRFTQPMLNALRMDDIRVSLSLSGMDGNDDQVRSVASTRGTYTAPPDRYMVVKAIVQNLARSPLVLSLSLSAEPSDYFAYDGVRKDIPLGRVQSQELKEHEAVVIFLAQGTFKLSAQVRAVAVGQESRVCGTESILVESQAD
ncbi:hypothetical protein A7U60_g8755 [Sanghuangporus baumii]|uniref:Uncharacterized protein n=1 Tax=Sanghuangporus baumii TaxID=108892 RepID=A0A9Q5HQG2_SANBA|nr:hypothetical protein A7U60_g8755 [Sanghuangporus baumii]